MESDTFVGAGSGLKILLMGSVDEKLILEEAACLEKMEKAVEVSILCGKKWNKCTTEKVSHCDGGILVENYHDSSYKVVREEIEVIHNMNKQVFPVELYKV